MNTHMKFFIRACTLAAVVLPTARVMQAQSSATAKQPANSCAFKSTDAWVARQKSFFDDASDKWSDDTLRVALLQAAGLALPLNMPVSYGVQIDGATPTLGANAGAMVEQLKKLAAVRGSAWPTRSVVGAAATHAVYLLVQQDTALARTALHRMMEAGPAESPAIDVAVFEDRLRLLSGRKQLYGTQFTKLNGKIVLAAIEDSAHADLRREGASLPPFKLGMCFAQQQR